MKKNKEKRIIIAVIIGVVVILSIITGVVLHFRSNVTNNPEGTVGNTAGNLYNGGLYCESDGYVYFSNAYDGNALYSMLPNETNIKKLASTEMSSINADSKFIYCYQNGSGSGTGLGYLFSVTGVYRIPKKNSQNSTCLDRITGKYVLLAGNDIYYTCTDDGVSLKKVSTSGKNKETLLELDILPVSVQNSTFYYINNEDNLHLMAYDLKTNSSKQVAAEDIYMPIIEGNTIYGIDIHNNYSLCRLDISTGEKTQLDSARTDLINLTDNYIYYQTSGDTPQLKRVRRDGSDMEVVADGSYSNINATSQYVYFTKFGSDIPVYKTPVYGAVNVTTFDAASAAAIQENK
jgi:hypothetical protein